MVTQRELEDVSSSREVLRPSRGSRVTEGDCVTTGSHTDWDRQLEEADSTSVQPFHADAGAFCYRCSYLFPHSQATKPYDLLIAPTLTLGAFSLGLF